MGIRNWFRRSAESSPPRAMTFALNSPEFYEYVRGGGDVGVNGALKNSAVFRAVDLIAGTMAALPLRIVKRGSGTVAEATDHPLFDLLMFRPNGWQTAYEFRQLMQAWLLIHGNAYARIVRGARRQVVALQPIDPARVEVRQDATGAVTYQVSALAGRESRELAQDEMFHLRGLSTDGIRGLSRVRQAADVINTALQAQIAANKLFQNGVIGGMAIEHPGKLTPAAMENLRTSLEALYAGPTNAGRTMILEEGMKRSFAPLDAKGAQLHEVRQSLVEDISRVFGVPRPLMMVEETSWGSGIEQLAILFVRFGLHPWFVAWEQAVERALMTPDERRRLRADYDERELLRGTLADQADYFAKALGAGGHRPWMEANEVRDLVGLGAHRDGGGLIAAGEMSDVSS